MGLMSDPTSGSQLVLTPCPVSLNGQKYLAAAWEPGEKLGAFLRRTVPDWRADAWEVRINGLLVPVEMLDRLTPRQPKAGGLLIEVRGIVKKQALYIVAFALLTWWTMGAFAAAGSAGGTVFGLSGMAAYAATAAVYAGGSMLINKVLGPKPPRAGSAPQVDPVHSISSARNTPRPYDCWPLLFGTYWITPDVVSNAYAWYQGNDQYIGMVLSPGLNVHHVEDIRHGDTPLDSFEGVQLFFSGMPGHPEQDIPLYSNADVLAGGELTPGGAWVERTSSPDTVVMQFDLEGLLYDVDSKGRFNGNDVTVFVEYRPTGTSDWTGSTSLRIHNRDTNTIRRTVTVNVDRGQYDTRVRLGTPRWNDGSPYDECRFNWVALKSIQADDADYTGMSRIGLRAKGTGQLNGAMDEVRMLGIAMPIPVWTGTGWVTQHTSNPGAHLLAYARGVRDGNGNPLWGLFLPDERIDIEALKAFMVHCAVNDYTYDAYIKEARSHAEIVDPIALAGFGQVTWARGKFSVVWASADQPLTAVVNMATMKRGSFQVDYTLANAADGVEFTYVDRETWRPVTLRVPAPGVATMHNPARITGEGITDEAHAAKMARYHLAQSLYQYKDISYGADLEHLTYQRMDKLALSHDMTQWGYSGQVLEVEVSGDGTVLVHLDVPVPALATPYIGLRLPGEGVYRVFGVVPFAGESDTLELNALWPADAPDVPGDSPDNPAHDTIWIYDIKATPGYTVRVVQVRPESNLAGAQVVVVPEGPEFWQFVETGEYIPPPNQSLLPGRPSVSGLTVTEHQVVQGDTVFTELGVAFNVTGKMAYATVTLAQWLIDGWSEPEQVAETRTTFARFRIPEAGVYTITVRPYGENGVVGIPGTVQYATEGADIPPPAFDTFNVVPLAGGVRKYFWGYDEGTIQAPDFAGAEIRYIAGEVSSPSWDSMTPVGETGFHTAAFEAVVPEAGTWTFAARARNTSGELSAPVVITRELAANLGEVIDEVEQSLDDITQAQVDAQMALDQEIADRLAADLATATAAAADATAKANAALATAMAAVDALAADVAEITGAPEWDPAETYEPGWLVKYDGSLYRSLVQTTGDQPDTSPAEWEKVGDYASLGEAVAAALTMATQNASDIAAEVARINALYARMPTGSGTLASEAYVVSEASALVTSIGVQATRVDGLLARMPAGSGTLATQASVNTVNQARIDGDQALASSINAVSTVANGAASTAGTALTAANNAASAATTAQTAAGNAQTTATNALNASADNASAITSVRAGMVGGGNLLPNSDFGLGTAGWTLAWSAPMTGTPTLFPHTTSPGSTYIPAARGGIFLNNSGATAIPAGGIMEANSTGANLRVPVVAGKRYIGSAYVATHRCDGTTFLQWLNAAGGHIAYSPQGTVVSATGTGGTLDNYARTHVVDVAPPGAAFVVLKVRCRGTTGAGSSSYFFITSPMIEECVSDTQNIPSPYSVGAAGVASVSQQALVTANSADGRLKAMHTVALDVNGHVSGTVNENDGTRSSFSILATVFRVISTLTGMGMEWQDGYLRIWRNAAQLILGHNFGTGDLLMWAGPNVGPANCTKANALFWLDTSGTGYFAGEVLQGVLRYFESSTTVSTTAQVSTGTINTKGKTVAVRGTLDYQATQDYLGGSSVITLGDGASSAMVYLERRYRNAADTAWESWVTLTSRRIPGSETVFNEAGSPSFIAWSIAGSISATDAASPRKREYRTRIASLTRRPHTVVNPGTTPAMVQDQYQSIESME